MRVLQCTLGRAYVGVYPIYAPRHHLILSPNHLVVPSVGDPWVVLYPLEHLVVWEGGSLALNGVGVDDP